MKKVPDNLAERLYDKGDQFLADGLDLRIDEVAEVVGVPRATLYYYFSGKDDLVSFLMTEKMDRIGGVVGKAIAAEGTALERFEAALKASVRELAAHPALCLNLMVATARMSVMAEVMFAADRAVMAPLRELLIEARAVGDAEVDDIDMTIAALMGGINMAVMQKFAMHGEVDPDAMAESLVPQVLNGVRTR